jgi:hypothetical protein
MANKQMEPVPGLFKEWLSYLPLTAEKLEMVPVYKNVQWNHWQEWSVNGAELLKDEECLKKVVDLFTHLPKPVLSQPDTVAAVQKLLEKLKSSWSYS